MRIELRSDSVVLDGYVNVTLRESRILPSPRGQFVEEIKPKTFERALMNTDSVDLLFNHDRSRKLGSTKEGNLELREDNVGLRAIATITDEQVMKSARAGELRGWSFGFASLKDEWSTRADGMQKRSIEELELYEVSVLDKTPAYIATSIEARGESDSVLTEMRSEEFQAKIEDNSSKTEDKTEKQEETKKQEESRKSPEPHYFEHLEKEAILLQLKGGN
jgi:Escherichia/Staphylococcus phage prohead protease